METTDVEIEEAIQLCRSRPFEVEAFAFLHSQLDWGGLVNRLRNERLRVIDFAFDWLRDTGLVNHMIRDCLWDWLQGFVIIDDLDDEEELGPIRSFVARGGIELAAREINDPSCHFAGTLLSIMSWCCMVPPFIPRIMSTGIHKGAIRFIYDDPEEDTAEISMSLLRALTGTDGPMRDCLFRDGLLDCVRVYLPDLHVPPNDVRLRRAFRASSIITRLAARDTSGAGKRVLLRHPRIITLTLEILERVLNVGSTGTVLNMSIDPHLITLDLLLLSAEPEYREHFTQAVPLLLRALDLRGLKNPLMTEDVMGILFDLTKSTRYLEQMQQPPTRAVLSGILSDILRLGKDHYSERTIALAVRLQGLVDITGFLDSPFRASPPPLPPTTSHRVSLHRVSDEEEVEDEEEDAEDVVVSDEDEEEQVVSNNEEEEDDEEERFEVDDRIEALVRRIMEAASNGQMISVTEADIEGLFSTAEADVEALFSNRSLSMDPAAEEEDDDLGTEEKPPLVVMDLDTVETPPPLTPNDLGGDEEEEMFTPPLEETTQDDSTDPKPSSVPSGASTDSIPVQDDSTDPNHPSPPSGAPTDSTPALPSTSIHKPNDDLDAQESNSRSTPDLQSIGFYAAVAMVAFGVSLALRIRNS